jgi:hypothetical protein
MPRSLRKVRAKTVRKLKRCPPPWPPDGTSASQRDMASVGRDDRGNWRIPRVKALQPKSPGFGSRGEPVELSVDPLSINRTLPKSPWASSTHGAGVRPPRQNTRGRNRTYSPAHASAVWARRARSQFVAHRIPVPMQSIRCFHDLVPCSFLEFDRACSPKEQQNSAFPPLETGF